MEAVGIVFLGGHDMTLGAKMNAQKAFLAEFFVDFNMALQNKSPKNLIFSTMFNVHCFPSTVFCS
jgi:hypothetical protein